MAPPFPTWNTSAWETLYFPSPYGPGRFEYYDIAIETTSRYTWLWASCMVLYLPIVWALGKFMENRPPVDVHFLLPLWNLLLGVFSLLGAIHIAPLLLQQLMQPGGFQHSVCSDDILHHTNGYWIWLFNLSKVPEFIDTIFLRLRKRPVIFLHWYHHIVTCAFCMYSNQTYFPGFGCPGGGRVIWFAAMNLTVHTVMYSYYFFAAIGMGKVLERYGINMVLTTMQLSQMAMGLVVLQRSTTCEKLIWDPTHPHSSNFGYWMGMVMYASYFLLFAQLFVDKYVLAPPRASSSNTAVATPVVTPVAMPTEPEAPVSADPTGHEGIVKRASKRRA